MSQFEVLDKDKHSQFRIRTGYGADLGDAVMYVMTYPLEFRDIQGCYPILFSKDPNTGGFFAAALFGFESEQNLFLKEDRWDAAYVPTMIQRQPFLIARRGENSNSSAVVSLDLDHPRVSRETGEALFDNTQHPTSFLDQKVAVLDKVHRGLQHNEGFMEALVRHDLLQQITLDITFNNGDKTSLQSFYGIAEEQLYQLGGDVLESLNQAGFLQPIFMVVASMSRMRDLIDRRNQLNA